MYLCQKALGLKILQVLINFWLIASTQWSHGGNSMRRVRHQPSFLQPLKFPPQPHQCVDSPLARSPAGKSGLKLLHTQAAGGQLASCPYMGIPHYSCRRVRPKSPHPNVKIGTGPRKRPPVSNLLKIRFFIHNIQGGWHLLFNRFQTRVSLDNLDKLLLGVNTTFPPPWISLLWV